MCLPKNLTSCCRTSTNKGITGPARTAVEYERKVIDTNIYIKNDFIGEPRPEMDVAWEELLKSTLRSSPHSHNLDNLLIYDVADQYSAVSPSELVDESSVKLNDVTGRVLITLEVFNSLNCLNYIRKFTFRSYYNKNDTDSEQFDAEVKHFGKCVERVRQTIMCYGDISFGTYVWIKDRLAPFPNTRNVHECKKWSNIQQWIEEHATPDLGNAMLMHPEFGIDIFSLHSTKNEYDANRT